MMRAWFGRLRRWAESLHGGQVVIAWLLLSLAGVGTIAGYFGMLGVVGHRDWPSEDRRPCLRPATRPPERVYETDDKVADALAKMRAQKLTGAPSGNSIADTLAQIRGAATTDELTIPQKLKANLDALRQRGASPDELEAEIARAQKALAAKGQREGLAAIREATRPPGRVDDDPLEHLLVIQLVERAHTNRNSIDRDELLKQLGFSWLREHPSATSATDTSGMLADLLRFETYSDSLDTLVQNAYLDARALRLDRECVTSHYKAIDRRISVLSWFAAALLSFFPISGLWMTWVWLGGRKRKPDVTP